MVSFSALGLRRWWDPDDREEVRSANAEHWPAVRERLLADYPPGTALTDVPKFRDFLRDAVLHDGWGAEDVAVWFGVSGARARAWVSDVLTPAESEERDGTSWRLWALDRFVPVGSEEARQRALVLSRAVEQDERLAGDVEALQRFVTEHGVVPNASELAKYRGASYQTIGSRWPGSYAEGWDRLYEEAGYERP